jgi:hypothetical protein
MAPACVFTYSITSLSDAFSGGGTPRPEKMTCSQWLRTADAFLPCTSFEKDSRAGELGPSTGSTPAPLSHCETRRRKSADTARRSRAVTGFPELITTA